MSAPATPSNHLPTDPVPASSAATGRDLSPARSAGNSSELPTGKPPLKSRLEANRENARKSTGPKSVDGKARSRANAVTHGLTAKIALPKATMIEIADHFWRLVNSYRPTGAVAVNAVLELTICSWKFRRLFEQYASHAAGAKAVVNLDRETRAKRQAQRWFARLPVEASKAMVHLERTPQGLSILIEALDNLVAELAQPDGAWTSKQYELAVNLAGFDYLDTWDHVHLRELWSAWFGCRPVRKSAAEEAQAYLPPNPEYKARARRAMDNAPTPAESRRTLTEWAESLRAKFAQRLEDAQSLSDELAALGPMAAGWPSPEETSQHLIYLRYSNQVDRKTRELQALIASQPAAGADEFWKFDEELLPADWKCVLLQHRTLRSIEKGIDEGSMILPVAEFMLKQIDFELDVQRELKCAMNTLQHEKEGRISTSALIVEEIAAQKARAEAAASDRAVASAEPLPHPESPSEDSTPKGAIPPTRTVTIVPNAAPPAKPVKIVPHASIARPETDNPQPSSCSEAGDEMPPESTAANAARLPHAGLAATVAADSVRASRPVPPAIASEPKPVSGAQKDSMRAFFLRLIDGTASEQDQVLMNKLLKEEQEARMQAASISEPRQRRLRPDRPGQDRKSRRPHDAKPKEPPVRIL